MIRILGIDPGLNHTGWGIVDAEGSSCRRVASGVIDVPKGETAERLGTIARELTEIIARHAPTEAACERVFVNVNPQSTLLLGQARGAALCAADLAGLRVEEFTPSEIKQAVTGSGRADKLMVQEMVMRLLALPEAPRPDEADALACAICSASMHRMRALEKSGGTSRIYAPARRLDEPSRQERRKAMIGRLHGKLIEKNPPQVLIDVGGVGYEVDIPMSTFYNLPDLGGDVTLFTHLVVREDAELLYGFATKAEQTAFRTLIRVSGVGPRIALAVLSGMTADQLASAIESGETGLLTRVPGIGKKTAERLILELKGKLSGGTLSVPAGAPGSARADIAAALIALGYSDREAQAAAKRVPEDTGVSEGIRLALKSLSR